MSDLFNNYGYVDPPKIEHFCRTCVHRQPWESSDKVYYYCSARKSKRTINGLLKIKLSNPSCVLYKEDEI